MRCCGIGKYLWNCIIVKRCLYFVGLMYVKEQIRRFLGLKEMSLAELQPNMCNASHDVLVSHIIIT